MTDNPCLNIFFSSNEISSLASFFSTTLIAPNNSPSEADALRSCNRASQLDWNAPKSRESFCAISQRRSYQSIPPRLLATLAILLKSKRASSIHSKLKLILVLVKILETEIQEAYLGFQLLNMT